jgi:four helix bundle protein
VESYKDLIVYQKGYELAHYVYQITKDFPKEDFHSLVSQMRSSAISIPCNIAEGYRRGHCKEYLQFLHIAYSSCSQLETLLSLSKDSALIDKDSFERIYLIQEVVSKLLKGLMLSLSGNIKKR